MTAGVPLPSLLFYAGLLLWVLLSHEVKTLVKRFIWSILIVMVLGYVLFPVPGTPDRGNKSKVFGIGLSRTGTTTLTKAMYQANYVAIHAPLNFFDYSSGRAVVNYEVCDGYDFVGDIMPSLKFEELALHYPEAKFILTKRNPSKFAKSAIEFFAPRRALWLAQDMLFSLGLFPLPTHRFFQDMYGEDYLTYDSLMWEAVYVKHEERVKSFFAGRWEKQRLLEIDVTEGEGWQKLSPFLGLVHNSSTQELEKVDVFKSILEQSLWSVENLVSWIFYWLS